MVNYMVNYMFKKNECLYVQGKLTSNYTLINVPQIAVHLAP